VPPTRPDLLWCAFFPELKESNLASVAPHHRDDTFDVLLLGGSVLHHGFGDVAERLREGLEAKLGRKVRVVNLANLGHTTRDSLNKYQRLTDKRFDLVLVYHGINDVRLNDTPPGAFRADYSHHTRFAQIAAIDRHRELPYLSFPYTTYYLLSSLADRWHLTDRPRPEFVSYGKDIRTPPAFEANMEAIAAIARERGDRLLLLTYAYHIPADYTEEAFLAGKLDYGGGRMSVEGWGEPANVVKTIDLHNAATRRVAARHPEVLFRDQAALMPRKGTYFNDPCHFTKAGCERFVENVLAGLDSEALKGGH